MADGRPWPAPSELLDFIINAYLNGLTHDEALFCANIQGLILIYPIFICFFPNLILKYPLKRVNMSLWTYFSLQRTSLVILLTLG